MQPQTPMEPGAAFAALGTPQGRQDPYPLYEAIRAHGNLVRLKPDRMVAVGYDECDRALRDVRLRVHDGDSYDVVYPDWRSHSSLRGFADSMLYRNAPDHDRLRGMVSSDFTLRRVVGLRHLIQEMTDKLLDGMARTGSGGSPVDLISDFAARLPIAVISRILGFPEDDQVWFRQMAADVAVALDGLADLSRIQLADAAMDNLSAYFAQKLDDVDRYPADSVFSKLARTYDASPAQTLSPELAGNLMLLLTAGFETTSFLIGHGVMLALTHPGFAERLRAEPEFAARFVEEILRYEPPVQVTSRWAGADMDLHGTTVPAGTKIALILAAANRDPRRFADPDRFDPDRVGNQPLSFGAGSHFCLGAPLARLEAQVALAGIFTRFPRLAEAGPPSHRDRVVVRGLESLPVAVG
jgi:cytochrome P450